MVLLLIIIVFNMLLANAVTTYAHYVGVFMHDLLKRI